MANERGPERAAGLNIIVRNGNSRRADSWKHATPANDPYQYVTSILVASTYSRQAKIRLRASTGMRCARRAPYGAVMTLPVTSPTRASVEMKPMASGGRFGTLQPEIT